MIQKSQKKQGGVALRATLPPLAATQIDTISAEIEAHKGHPVHVFRRDNRIIEIAAFQIGEWIGSVAGSPNGPGLIAMDESGQVIYRGRSIQAAVRSALHFE